MRGRRTRLAAGCVALALAVRPASPVDAETTATRELRVGSKSFTESVILGEIVTQLLRGHGRGASHRPGFGGTRLLWDALADGAIDIYPEYTGTLIEEILASESAAAAARDQAGATDRASGPRWPSPEWLVKTLAARGIGVIGPLGFNNTYALGVRRDLARRLGLKSISDLRAHPELRLGFSSEFMSRRDGWPALRARYGLPQTDARGLDHDLAYRGIAQGAIDATDLYATDPEIRQHGILVLDDDLHGFPRYDAVLLYRLDLMGWAGSSIAALERLAGQIDEATMASMNARVKLDRIPDRIVAADFLRAKLAVEPSQERPPTLAQTIGRHALEHLVLVALSLLAAIAVAIPLGVLAAWKPRIGHVLLGVVGVIQTVPSLALLVFMIPLLGIGTRPALVALFLYSLLPIVRNTHAGLRNISPALMESAHALGLSRGAILGRVQLPLASPLILAGIKSAAVINVGTATLGALIGAGGFGQPIFTGIRLDDLGLILQGAVPASLLALAVQGVFEIVERFVVPRGLRPKALV